MDELQTNVLYYGDNLEILRKHIPDNSIDLIYLDPPFNSKASYNILFKEPTGEQSAAQIKAFSDTWHWDQVAEDTFQDIILNAPPKVAKLIDAIIGGLERNDVTAYLVMMTIRLVELHRVLKDTGSLYLHCDPTASHYLKLVLDQVFGTRNFKNEVIWHYQTGGRARTYYSRKHDVILFYTKGKNFIFNADKIGAPRGERLGHHMKKNIDKDGRVFWTIRSAGKLYKYYEDDILTSADVWTDISHMQQKDPQRLGYQTQKPLALLERIIKASSSEGDVVLDPFCGCGTVLVAAQKLNRKWIGIDVTHLAIAVMKSRLEESFRGIQFEVIGEPEDLAGAKALAKQDRYQFQWWALSRIKAKPFPEERRKGADKGIDGVIDFVDLDEATGKEGMKRAVVSVKSGHVHVKDIRELKDIASRQAMGVFITLEPPTREMRTEAVSAGSYHSPLWDRDEATGKDGMKRAVVSVKSGHVHVKDIRELKDIASRHAMGVFITLEPPTREMRTEAVSAGSYHSPLWNKDFPKIQILTIEELLKGNAVDMPPATSPYAKAPRVSKKEGAQIALEGGS